MLNTTELVEISVELIYLLIFILCVIYITMMDTLKIHYASSNKLDYNNIKDWLVLTVVGTYIVCYLTYLCTELKL